MTPKIFWAHHKMINVGFSGGGKREILMYSPPIPTSVINIRSLDGASLSLPPRQTGQKIAVPLLGLFAFRNPTHTPVTHSSVTSQVKNFSYKDKYHSMKKKGKKRKHHIYWMKTKGTGLFRRIGSLLKEITTPT